MSNTKSPKGNQRAIIILRVFLPSFLQANNKKKEEPKLRENLKF